MKHTLLFITHYSEMYGANRSLLQLMIELRMKFDLVPVVLLRSSGEITEALDREGIPYVISHFYWWVNQEKGLFKKLLNIRKQIINKFRVAKIIKLIEPFNIKLVYSNSIAINIGYYIKKELNLPHIWHIRESMIQFDFKWSIGNNCSKRLLKKAADKYILISDYLFDYYKLDLPGKKMIRIYNGINFSNVKIRKNLFKGVLNLCILGVVSNNKNQLDAIKAIKILRDKYKLFNIQLNIIGGYESEYYEELLSYIIENKLGDSIVFHGHQKEVNKLLSNMNIGLMCSRDEAFGRVTIEYMLHSMPVVASISGANTEIIKDGVNGFIYPLGDAEALASKINYLFDNSQMIEQMGSEAYMYAKENFSSDRNTDAIYNEIMKLL